MKTKAATYTQVASYADPREAEGAVSILNKHFADTQFLDMYPDGNGGIAIMAPYVLSGEALAYVEGILAGVRLARE